MKLNKVLSLEKMFEFRKFEITSDKIEKKDYLVIDENSTFFELHLH
jgi:hypothetical protein